MVKLEAALGCTPGYLVDSLSPEPHVTTNERNSTLDISHKENVTLPVHEIGNLVGQLADLMNDEHTVATWAIPPDLAPESPQKLRMLRVRNDSMAPVFLPDDRVMVDLTDRDPAAGGYFAIWNGGALLIRRVEIIPRSDPLSVKISPENPRYTPDVCPIAEAQIQGRICGRWTRM